MNRYRQPEWWLINLLLGLCVLAFAVGIWAPMLTLKKLLFISNTFSVLSGIWQLALEGRYGLFALVGVFTLLLPVVKLAVLFRAWNSVHSGERARRHLRWLAALSKWSMLDVFVVAVLIAAVKLGALVSLELHHGLYVFATAVLLIMLATHLIQRRLTAG